jgi:hypothetical protein
MGIVRSLFSRYSTASSPPKRSASAAQRDESESAFPDTVALPSSADQDLRSVAQPQQTAAAAAAATPPKGQFSYDPQLIGGLVRDHLDLVEVYGAIETATLAKNYPAAMAAMQLFKSRLTDHLIVENTRLYLYIKSTVAALDPESVQLARDFQTEMNQIARQVVAFTTTYSGGGSDALAQPEFLVALRGIGHALVNRIRREEATLYPLYAPVA